MMYTWIIYMICVSGIMHHICCSIIHAIYGFIVVPFTCYCDYKLLHSLIVL